MENKDLEITAEDVESCKFTKDQLMKMDKEKLADMIISGESELAELCIKMVKKASSKTTEATAFLKKASNEISGYNEGFDSYKKVNKFYMTLLFAGGYLAGFIVQMIINSTK